MGLLRRLHPLDLAAAAVALLLVVYLVVTLPGYDWKQTAEGGFLKALEVRVLLEVTQPSLVLVAEELESGPLEAETLRGQESITIKAVNSSPAGSVQIELALTALLDSSNRAFWNDQRLRPGDPFEFGDSRRRVAGVIVAVDGLDGRGP